MASVTSMSRMTKCEREYVFNRSFGKMMPKSDALLFGTVYHYGVEHGKNNGIILAKKEGLEHKIDLLVEMWDRYEAKTSGLTMIKHEQKVELEIEGTDEKFIGYIDGVVEKEGHKMLLELKTAAFIDVSVLNIDAQVTAYLWAARELGMITAPYEMVYYINTKKKAKEPRKLKNGDLSTAKNQGVTYEKYYEAIEETYTRKGIPIPGGVSDYLVWLEDNGAVLDYYTVMRKTDYQLDVFGERIKELIIKEGKLKARMKEDELEVIRTALVMPSKFACQMCQYKRLCLFFEEDVNNEITKEFLEDVIKEDIDENTSSR